METEALSRRATSDAAARRSKPAEMWCCRFPRPTATALLARRVSFARAPAVADCAGWWSPRLPPVWAPLPPRIRDLPEQVLARGARQVLSLPASCARAKGLCAADRSRRRASRSLDRLRRALHCPTLRASRPNCGAPRASPRLAACPHGVTAPVRGQAAWWIRGAHTAPALPSTTRKIESSAERTCVETLGLDTIAGAQLLRLKFGAAGAFQPDQAVVHGDRRARFIRMKNGAAIIQHWGDSHALAVPVETLSLPPEKQRSVALGAPTGATPRGRPLVVRTNPGWLPRRHGRRRPALRP